MTSTTEMVPGYLDMTKMAISSFLARYREPTLTAYTQDLKTFLGRCQTYDRSVLRVNRGGLESYVRYLESRGYAPATIARRFATVACFYKYAVIAARAGQGLPSRPTSHCRSRYCVPSARSSTAARADRSCAPAAGGGWTEPAPAAP